MADDKLSFNNLIHLLTVKLDSTNYLFWKRQVHLLLRSQKLFGHLDGSTPCPPAPASNAGDDIDEIDDDGFTSSHSIKEAIFEAWKTEDEKLCSLLLSSISVEVMFEISACDTAADIWNTLASVFQNRSESAALSLRVKVLSLRKTGTVHDLHLKFKAIFDQLAATDTPATNNEQVLWFLTALGVDYKDFSALMFQRKPLPAYVEVVSEAENHEAFLNNLQHFNGPSVLAAGQAVFLADQQPSDEAAGSAWGSRAARGGSAWRSRAGRGGRSGGRGRSDGRGWSSGRSGGSGSGSSRPFCDYCNKPGHFPQTCFRLFPNLRHGHSANLAAQFQTSLQMEPSSTASDWYVDSGATSHLTSTASVLESVTPYHAQGDQGSRGKGSQ